MKTKTATTMNKPRILFFGTPVFAAVCLETLAASEYGDCIAGVVTGVDKPRDRGHGVTPSDTKLAAQKLGYPIYQPENLKKDNFLSVLEEIKPDMLIVAAYGKIFPGYLLDYPKYGCINVHGSVLPRYRGAAPIQRAMMNGDKTLGVTVMQMAAGIDTGDMYATAEYVPETDECFGSVYEKLAVLGTKSLINVLPDIVSGKAIPQKQDESLATYAHKIEKEELLIDFSRGAAEICAYVRAFSPSPLAYTYLDGNKIKITLARAENPPVMPDKEIENGGVAYLSGKGSGAIYVKTGDGYVSVIKLIPQGKKEMCAGDFVRGRSVNESSVFGR